jgi:hypothetical protein
MKIYTFAAVLVLRSVDYAAAETYYNEEEFMVSVDLFLLIRLKKQKNLHRRENATFCKIYRFWKDFGFEYFSSNLIENLKLIDFRVMRKRAFPFNNCSCSLSFS